MLLTTYYRYSEPIMRIAILGADGQLGAELCHLLGGDAIPCDRRQIDITDVDRSAEALNQISPESIINCAAYNAVDTAESQPDEAFRVNALGPRALAAYCERHALPLIHVSTDYVFGLDAQRNVPYRESDLPGPQGVYAVTKLAGEEFVRSGCARHFIVRTCGLYGRRGKSGKRNFVETMLKLGQERSELRIVSDQRCTPTSTKDLAGALVGLLSTTAYGTYHATNAGDCSWAEFAEEIFRQANYAARVIPITTAEYGAKAPRPGYSVLDGGKLAQVLGRPLRSWRDALSDYLSERGA